MKRFPLGLVAGAMLLAAPAWADYPLSGRWTYEDVSGAGPAKNCGNRRMEFSGNQRHDSKGGVHEYRNVSVTQNGAQSWRVVDEFSNGQISAGRVIYTLTRRDQDHIEVKMTRGGAVFRLRRCM